MDDLLCIIKAAEVERLEVLANALGSSLQENFILAEGVSQTLKIGGAAICAQVVPRHLPWGTR